MILKPLKYKILFSIGFNHSYFAENPVKNNLLELIPFSTTVHLLKNYRIVIKKTENAWLAIQEYHSDEKIEPVVELSQLTLNFIIKSNSSYFLNITELPFFNVSDQLLFFANKQIKKKSVKQNLSKQEFVNETDLINTSRLKDIFTENVNLPPQTVGCVQIQFFPELLKYLETDFDNKIDFLISFKSRQTYWKYTLIKKYSEIDKMLIIDENKKTIFNALEIDNQKDEKNFVSDKKISMNEQNLQFFKLIIRNGTSTSEKIIKEKLPAPLIQNIIMENKEFYSQIFIYI